MTQKKLGAYFKELFYRCSNPSLMIYYFPPKYYEKLALGTGLWDNPYNYKFEDHWYTVSKEIFVTWDDYIKVLEKGEYYDFAKKD